MPFANQAGLDHRGVDMGDRVVGMRKRPSEDGFTLIELLVVIIILGILSAVVVFAVRGAGDKGSAAANATDLKTIRTAEEVYCAKFGKYGSGQDLVDAKFLSELPKLHAVAPTAGGTCKGAGDPNATGFTTPCDLSQPCSKLTVGMTSDSNSLTGPTASLGFQTPHTGIFETLLDLDPSYNILPGLAVSLPTRIPAGTNPTYPTVDTWRFNIRPGVTFHNGAALDANAVKVGLFDRVAGQSGGSGIRSSLQSALVVDNTCTSAANCIIDFTPTVQNLRVPQQIVHPTYSVVAPGTIAGQTAPGAYQAVGTGPFTFGSYTPAQSLVMNRNAAYWGAKAASSQVTFKFISDNTVRRQALEAGTVDVIYDTPRPDVPSLKSQGFQIANSTVGTYQAMFANIHPSAAFPQYDILTDLNVRKAVSLAVKRSDIVNVTFGGLATLDQTLVPPNTMSPYQTRVTGYPFDLAQANTLLDGAGWTGAREADGTRTKAGRPLELLLNSGFPTMEINKPVPAAIQLQLKAAGIRVVLNENTSQYSPRMISGEGDLWIEQGNQNDANPSFLPQLLLYSGTGSPPICNTTGTVVRGYTARFGPGAAADPCAAPVGSAFDTSLSTVATEPNLDPVKASTADAMHDFVDTQAIGIVIAGLSRVYGMKPSVVGLQAHPASVHFKWALVTKTG